MRRFALSMVSASLLLAGGGTLRAQALTPSDPLGPNGRLYFDIYRQQATERSLRNTQQQLYDQGQVIRQGFIVRSEEAVNETGNEFNTINPRTRTRTAATRGGPNPFERGTRGYFQNYGGYYRMPAPAQRVASGPATTPAPSLSSHAQSYSNPSSAAGAPISIGVPPPASP